MAKFNIVKAGKAQKSTYIKALVYGESGAGKSFLAATAPKPLILLTEINGQASIMHSNPDADILHITSSDMLAEVLKMTRKKQHSFFELYNEPQSALRVHTCA